MIENPQQRLIPVPVSFAKLASQRFPGLIRADLMGSRLVGDFTSDGIDWAQEQITGADAEVSHIMRYLGRGLVIDQQDTLQLRPLSAYIGYMVRTYHWPGYNLAQRNSLVVESLIRSGPYDYWAVAGHGLEAVLGVDGLAEKMHREDAFDCSEGAYEMERIEMPNFLGARPAQVMPTEIDKGCINAGWQVVTWLLTE